ncbi:hypothetical protein OIU74_024404 [Salix koriyanagi]|uniref:Uncharacterized protein n=1 Tax=Salix koriyanagi TaxID=2511006 RepID=A0A9Q0W9Y7_9ROSI|nr:hypothetical protein OIU74_024404 [Salix koriyanagi]
MVLSMLSSPVGAEKSRLKMLSVPTVAARSSDSSWKKAPLWKYFCINLHFCFGGGAGFGFFLSQSLLSSSVMFRTLSISSLSFNIASRSSLSLLILAISLTFQASYSSASFISSSVSTSAMFASVSRFL